MARLVRDIPKKAGIEAGTLVHIGRRIEGAPRITVATYDAGHAVQREVKDIAECFPLPDKEKVTWININGLHDVNIIRALGDNFGFHPLFLEDIMNSQSRLKIEDFDEYIFVVMKMMYLEDGAGEIAQEQTSLIFGKNYVISFQEPERDAFAQVREMILKSKCRARNEGSDYLAYLLIDTIVDNYFDVIEKIGDGIDVTEEILMGSPDHDSYQEIHQLKKEALFLRKSILPIREIVSYLERGETNLVKDTTRIYYKDIYDHTIQIMDTLDTYRDIISGLLDMYLSSISNRMNQIMKVLTVFATIFIPLTFLAGVYGMNFKNMPEINSWWGYPAFWLVVVTVSGTMLFMFWRKGWLR